MKNHSKQSCRLVFLLALLAGISSMTVSEESDASRTTACDSKDAVVGDLKFSIVSIRASQNGNKSLVTVSLSIQNQGKEPIALNYAHNTGRIVDDKGYIYDSFINITGIGVSRSREASLDYVIEPERDMGVQVVFTRFHEKGQTIGTNFDFAAEFASYKDKGEGKVERIRAYPVSIVDAKR